MSAEGHVKREGDTPAEAATARQHSKRRKTDEDQADRGGEESPFRPKAMQDASRQIRLLRLLPRIYNHELAYAVSLHDLDDSPDFVAISYTWGDLPISDDRVPSEYAPSPPRSVLIDGRSCAVRQNCRYALWQASQHVPDSYVWIDSICIDQDDLHEKSRQVRMMYRIYSRASAVLACVGEHVNDSAVLYGLTEFRLESLQGDLDEWEGMSKNERLEYRLAWREGKFAQRLIRSYLDFFRRPYWSRVWIVQEMVAPLRKGGPRQLQILCGPDCMSWEEMQFLTKVMSNLAGHESRGRGGAQAASHGTISLTSALALYGGYGCTDMRDKLYALLDLVEWKDIPRPVPDYRKSILEVAAQALDHVSLDETKNLLKCFRVDNRMVEVQEEIQQRRKTSVQPSKGLRIARRPQELFIAQRLFFDSKGRLTTTLVHHPRKKYYMSWIRRQPGLIAAATPVFSGSAMAAIVPKTARAGDMVIAVPQTFANPDYKPGELWLVLRHRTGLKFKIVGQGFTIAGHELQRHEDRLGNQWNRLPFNLDLSSMDWFVLLAQDMINSLEYSPNERWARLSTSVTQTEGLVELQSSLNMPEQVLSHVVCQGLRSLQDDFDQYCEAQNQQSGGGGP